MMKLHNIYATSKITKKVVVALDFSKASGVYCISVVVLNNCEPDPSFVLAEPLNMRLKKSCFKDFLSVSSLFFSVCFPLVTNIWTLAQDTGIF